MMRYRKLLNQLDEQICPICFVLGFHTIIHILGIYAITQLPYSWNLGVNYANTVTKCVAAGRMAIESEIEYLNQRVERFKDTLSFPPSRELHVRKK